ncbi:barstar family protein [Niabella sp.]|uniref:barstar family protein n=1 Tax=Niabella sp. TaxID=1962976 RepID=UPI0026213621|nr:barstar family protein [Niabella sp.]
MKTIIFDFDRIGTEEDFYKTAVKQLALPDFFGNNLDALYDVLTGSIELPVTIQFVHLSLGQLEKFDAIITVFEDAAVALEDDLIFEYYLKKP